jgi:hypothetical protein
LFSALHFPSRLCFRLAAQLPTARLFSAGKRKVEKVLADSESSVIVVLVGRENKARQKEKSMTTETKNNLEIARKNIGAYFWFKSHKCQVVCADSFNGVVHYGFLTVTDYKLSERQIAGWIPFELVGQTEL